MEKACPVKHQLCFLYHFFLVPIIFNWFKVYGRSFLAWISYLLLAFGALAQAEYQKLYNSVSANEVGKTLGSIHLTFCANGHWFCNLWSIERGPHRSNSLPSWDASPSREPYLFPQWLHITTRRIIITRVDAPSRVRFQCRGDSGSDGNVSKAIHEADTPTYWHPGTWYLVIICALIK